MRERLALDMAWLATAWMAVVLVVSIADYTRGVDVVALALALPVQLTVVIGWSLFARLPLWLVAGHGLIMLALGIGLVIAGPPLAPPSELLGLAMPWLVVGLIPSGAAMIVAAWMHWRPSDSLVH
jgi:hypothetical protein